MKFQPYWAIPVVLFLACQSSTEHKPDFLAADIDTTVSPANDFFLYANGGWIKKNSIPDAESRWGLGDLVREEIYVRLKKINAEALDEKAPEGSITQKIGDFWYSAMDSADIEKNGLIPLQSELDKIKDIRTKEDLAEETAALHNIGIYVLFGDYVDQDAKNSETMVYGLYQGGLGLPNRDYYFNTDEKTVSVRKAYNNYLFRTFEQLGADSAAASQKSYAVYQLETRLAKASRKRSELRDPYKNYHKMNMASLKELSTQFNWPTFLHQIGISKPDSVVVGQPEFFTALDNEIKILLWMNGRIISGFISYWEALHFWIAKHIICILIIVHRLPEPKKSKQDGKGHWTQKSRPLEKPWVSCL
jgi:putative endopeptidase